MLSFQHYIFIASYKSWLLSFVLCQKQHYKNKKGYPVEYNFLDFFCRDLEMIREYTEDRDNLERQIEILQ